MSDPVDRVDNDGPPLPDLDFIDTIRDFPEYFPSTLSPDEWMNLLISSHRAEWDAHVEKRKTFEDKHRQWQARKAELERRRSEVARSRFFQAWMALREEAWNVESLGWIAEEEKMLSEEAALEAEVASAVSLGPGKKSEKKKREEHIIPESTSGVPPARTTAIQSDDAAPSAPSMTGLMVSSAPLDTEAVTLNISAGAASGSAVSFGDGDEPTMATDGTPSSIKASPAAIVSTIDQPPTAIVGGAEPGPQSSADGLDGTLDPKTEAGQRKMEEESVEVSSSVSERLHAMLLQRAELFIAEDKLARQLEDCPEKNRLERLAEKCRSQLSTRYYAGTDMGSKKFRSNIQRGTMSLYGSPETTEVYIEAKLEYVLSPSANSIWFSFQLDPSTHGDNWLGQKTRIKNILRRYDLSNYMDEAEGKQRLMTVDMPSAAFKSWVLSYAKRAGLETWKV